MGPFGGFLMPIQYEGILSEHQAAREKSALFDTCHMGEFLLGGSGALDDLQHLVSCDVASLAMGQCRYGFMCNETGGVIDDLLIYRLAEAEFMLVVNAGTQDSDFEWIQSQLSAETRTTNVSDETGKLDIQGPGSPGIVNELMGEPIGDLRFYRFMKNTYRGQDVIVSRTDTRAKSVSKSMATRRSPRRSGTIA
jgi:aminomethyltransferase